MSGDKLVFDLANEIEDVPNIFVRKDWINILDNQNGNYNSNQSVIDTSQLSNSNKYIAYREGYLATPMLMTLTGSAGTPATSTTSQDFAIGLKNWFGSIIHSLTLDFNGTTIIQQTPYVNMWNAFKLMTSLSWQDVENFGATMGFYPDDPLSWTFQYNAVGAEGKGVCNNSNMCPPVNCLGVRSGIVGGNAYNLFNSYKSGLGNVGFLKRQLYVNYDPDGACGNNTYGTADDGLLTSASATQLWKSHIIKKNDAQHVFQVAILGFIHLRHIHSFFNQIPLIKGAFMKLTLNLNNTSVSFTTANAPVDSITVTSVSNAVGGVCPLMIASASRTSVASATSTGTAGGDQLLNGVATFTYANGGATLTAGNYIASLSVGARCLNSSQANVDESSMARSIYLYVPAYSFNAVFEQAYISSPIKKVIYEDIYQYQVLNVGAKTGQVNNLITNGIANLRSILVLPFFSASQNEHLCANGIPVYQSPFDPAGCGATSPLCMLTNFNIVVSGQNAIYNTVRYSHEEFINQVYGCNSVNSGMTDGLSSSLISQQGWEMEYCFHYVDISRMLPVEQQVPKSVQIIGQNTSQQKLDLWCFLAYGCELKFDIVSGARV